MKFKEWLQETQGLFSQIATSGSPVNFLKPQIKAHQTVKNKGTTIGRMMSAGKVKNPASPPKLNPSSL